jgi:hypothetical protein
MHKPNLRQRETRALAFWREVDAAIRSVGAPPLSFREISTLFDCGYSVNQAVRALAPAYREGRA